jgi:hypothetical protein
MHTKPELPYKQWEAMWPTWLQFMIRSSVLPMWWRGSQKMSLLDLPC